MKNFHTNFYVLIELHESFLIENSCNSINCGWFEKHSCRNFSDEI